MQTAIKSIPGPEPIGLYGDSKPEQGERVVVMRLVGCLAAVVVLLGASSPSFACTVIGVGKKASIDGSVIVSHSDAGVDSRIRVVPGRTYKEGEKAPVYWGLQDAKRPLDEYGEVLGYIPQVKQTYTYFHSAYSHINEHQLAIGESTTEQKSELIVEKGKGDQIMTIEQAQIFALQRCRKAREAVSLIGSLVETYGFLPSSAGGAEILLIGDPDEAWVLEVFGVGPGWKKNSGKLGAVWAAQRLPDDHVTMIPNWSVIKEIRPEDAADFLVSKNWKQEAIERGWYDPKAGRPFVWQDIYAPLPGEWATGRFWLFYKTYAPQAAKWPDRSLGTDPHKGLEQFFQIVEPLSLYPFSIKPEKPLSVQDVIAFQRSTMEGTIYDMTAEPQWLVADGKGGFVKSPLATPFPSRDLRRLLRLTNRRPVARHRGQYGMVAQLRAWLPAALGGVYWVYLDNPYFSPYVPIYAGAQDTAESYKTYDPEKFSAKSARWAIDFVDNLANLRFQDMIKDVRAVRDPFEARLFADQPVLEKEALRLYKKSPSQAKTFLTRHTQAAMDEVLRMFTELRETLIVKYTTNRE